MVRTAKEDSLTTKRASFPQSSASHNLDIAGDNQPMWNEDGKVGRHLQQQNLSSRRATPKLERRGIRFAAIINTEVLCAWL